MSVNIPVSAGSCVCEWLTLCVCVLICACMFLCVLARAFIKRYYCCYVKLTADIVVVFSVLYFLAMYYMIDEIVAYVA